MSGPLTIIDDIVDEKPAPKPKKIGSSKLYDSREQARRKKKRQRQNRKKGRK